MPKTRLFYTACLLLAGSVAAPKSTIVRLIKENAKVGNIFNKSLKYHYYFLFFYYCIKTNLRKVGGFAGVAIQFQSTVNENSWFIIKS